MYENNNPACERSAARKAARLQEARRRANAQRAMIRHISQALFVASGVFFGLFGCYSSFYMIGGAPQLIPTVCFTAVAALILLWCALLLVD